jgi:hypothetical protein
VCVVADGEVVRKKTITVERTSVDRTPSPLWFVHIFMDSTHSIQETLAVHESTKKEESNGEFKIHQNVVRIKNDGIEWRDPQLEYCGKKVHIPEEEMIEQFSEHSWEEVSWDTAREEIAKQVLSSDSSVLPPELQSKHSTSLLKRLI